MNNEILTMPFDKVRIFNLTPIEVSTVGGTGPIISGDNLMNESNLIIEPVVSKCDTGAEITVAWKVTATIYCIIHDSSKDFLRMLDEISKLEKTDVEIDLKNDGSFIQPAGSATLLRFKGNNQLNMQYRTETTQGLYRYVIKLYGVIKEFPQTNFI